MVTTGVGDTCISCVEMQLSMPGMCGGCKQHACALLIGDIEHLELQLHEQKDFHSASGGETTACADPMVMDQLRRMYALLDYTDPIVLDELSRMYAMRQSM
jgi:hypothetical protein